MDLKELLDIMPNTFIPLFVAIDIFAVLPIYMSLTADVPDMRKKRIVTQSALTALVVSLAFTAVGRWTFGVLGITTNDFKVAGGMVLLVFAILDLTRYERKKLKDTSTVGVVPIGVPLLVGPAVLTTILVLVDRYGTLPTVLSLVLNLLFAWACLLLARRLMLVLGANGITALSKIMALLLAAIAVMMIRLGIQGIWAGSP